MLPIQIYHQIKINHLSVRIHKRSSTRKDLEVHKAVKDRCMVHQCIKGFTKVRLPSKEHWKLWMSMTAHSLMEEWVMIWRTEEAAANHQEWWPAHHQIWCLEDSIRWCLTDRKLKRRSIELLQFRALARHSSIGTRQENKDSAREKQAAAATAAETTANSSMKGVWEERKKWKRYNKEQSLSKIDKRSRIIHSSHKSIKSPKIWDVWIMKSPRTSSWSMAKQ